MRCLSVLFRLIPVLLVSMSISTIRRQVKNVAYNFSDAQVKVREATSNDPWGPSTALMSEIADLTHNPLSFTEIMSMLWKRLNDHGKNWRHVYKSLVLLDYLIKCGSEKVAQQCRENIYSIETLKDFQHIEDNRDQGMNVREKAKQMVSLLYDEERLKNERTKFMMTRKKFMSGSGISSDGSVRHTRKTDTGPGFESELEDARPASAGEEEMQLQIALVLSREESEKEEELRKKDDIGLQMALNESRREIERMNSMDVGDQNTVPSSTLSQSAIDDLLSLGVGQPVEQTTPNPWGGPVADPWAPASGTAPALVVGSSLYSKIQTTSNDPWTLAPPTAGVTTNSVDPWATVPSPANHSPDFIAEENISKQRSSTKTPESFLGENSSLVNLDNLLGTTSNSIKPASNPFLSGTSATVPINPFVAQQRPSPSLNEMMSQSRMPPTGNPVQTAMQPPLMPVPASASPQPTNPFC
ncbi:hypothetical protein LOAG_17830 [Loa loa]|uniref:ENTH domain-containing protein n=2 Tax=Loa loa TaxID=7209 RepID=A0A1S0UHI5_LOALO|nr:hypothetical protein LOAG_17830 [Loa loa]EJD74921.1 hypothetical protein LOAG_17830 [Loa loa]